MNTPPGHADVPIAACPRPYRNQCRRVFGNAALALSLTAPMVASAGVGEASDIELRSVGMPMSTGIETSRHQPRSREQVRNELAVARAANMLPNSGEIADTPEVLAARDAFNELQAEVLSAQYAAQQQQLAGLSPGQLLRMALESGQPVVVLVFQDEDTVLDEDDDGI
jgi:hypothetical protein